MSTLIGGQYNACPINLLPTGYMVWCIENGKFKRQWELFNNELKQRTELNKEPKVTRDLVVDEFWFNEMDATSQKRYISMMTTGAWNWSPKKPKDITAQNKLVEVMVTLNTLFPSTDEDDSGFSELFIEPKNNKQALIDILKKDVPQDIELGAGETEDDITMEEANDILFQRLKANKSTNAQVEDILHKLRTRNASDQQAQTYQSILNQLSHITSIVTEQEDQFTLWELRDIEWHLDTVKNRLYWLLRQREDF